MNSLSNNNDNHDAAICKIWIQISWEHIKWPYPCILGSKGCDDRVFMSKGESYVWVYIQWLHAHFFSDFVDIHFIVIEIYLDGLSAIVNQHILKKEPITFI